MTPGWAGPLIAAGIAAGVSALELINARRKGISPKAFGWLVLRFVFDGGVAAFGYPFIAAAMADTAGVAPAVVAGLAGPAVLRAELNLAVPGGEDGDRRQLSVGPATVYQRLRRQIDDAIDDVCSVAQSRWLNRKALPAIDRLPLQLIVDQAEQYLRALDRLSESVRDEDIAFLVKVRDDVATSEYDRRRLIVQRLLDTGGRRLVRGLMRDGRAVKVPVADAPTIPTAGPV